MLPKVYLYAYLNRVRSSRRLNVQSIVDDKHKLIIHTEATNENDLNPIRQIIEESTSYVGLEKNQRSWPKKAITTRLN